MNVEEGIKMVISGGIVTPKFKQKYTRDIRKISKANPR